LHRAEGNNTDYYFFQKKDAKSAKRPNARWMSGDLIEKAGENDFWEDGWIIWISSWFIRKRRDAQTSKAVEDVRYGIFDVSKGGAEV
jgi:hypothetical protein